MVPFDKIHKAALHRLGEAALAARLPSVKSAAELRKLGDDRYLSLMAQRIFRAGLKHDVVEARWPAFEEAFRRFDPRLVRAMSDEEIEDMMMDSRLIRHLVKLRAVHANAAALCTIAEERGGVGAYLAGWPGEDVVGLWSDLARRCAQMGGNSAAYFLRMAGKDTFILTPSTVAALQGWNAVKGEPKTKADRTAVQAIFNAWADKTKLPLAHLSMILAASID
jgi:3-methyladenine DNA glycosylase Tag